MAPNDKWSRTRQIRAAQWVLPLCLFVLAASFETLEHIVGAEAGVNLVYSLEILVFGVVGPMAVWWVLGWARRNQAVVEEANASIQEMNRRLERGVAVRTAELAERTAELAEKNDALAEANADLMALDRMKSDFVSLVSHELRTPLTNINGGIELIRQDRAALEPARREALDVLRAEGLRLTRLVQNILDASLLESGRLVPQRRPLLLEPFLDRLLEGRLPADGPHRLVIDVPSDLVPACVDEGHLADVVVNLVDNAIKYSPDGGEIRVSASAGEEDPIVLSVSDQGIGIPPAEQHHLFERFYRANHAPDREVYGHGLGLFFCRKLVEAQDGRIRVESPGVPGQGSVFHVGLPVCPDGGCDAPHPAD